jgi:hypothetical protein
LAATLCALLAGCGARTNPDLEALRISYLRASGDSALRTNAGQDLAAAEATLRRAEEVWAKGGDEREVDHLVYMARRRLELAQTKAAYAEARAEIGRAAARPEAAVSEEGGGLAPAYEIDRALSVTQRSMADGTVVGEVTNRSTSTIRDVELMIRYEWFWANEMHPGDYSPGRTERFELPDRIAPGQTASFRYAPAVPLPQRNDGHFEVSIRPVGFVELPD